MNAMQPDWATVNKKLVTVEQALLNLRNAVAVWAPISMTPDNKRSIVILIKTVVAAHFGITLAEMDSSRRTEELVWPRQVAMALSGSHSELPPASIGLLFGGRDRGTVIWAIHQVANRCAADRRAKATVDMLRDTITTALKQRHISNGNTFSTGQTRKVGGGTAHG